MSHQLSLTSKQITNLQEKWSGVEEYVIQQNYILFTCKKS